MEASRYVCSLLHRLNPSLRLGWVGRKRQYPEELNAGDYALVQLYPMRLVASYEQPQIAEELWHVTDRVDQFGKPYRARVSRGALFNKTGGLTPDWDPLQFVPVYKAKFVDYGLSNEAVMQGGFRPLVERWQTAMRERFRKSVEGARRDVRSKMEDLGREGARKWWFEGNKSGAVGSHSVLKEERIAVEKQFEEKRQAFEAFTRKYYGGGLL